ncbi:ribonuclease H-like domain-containing protein [Tanacetum coccineum]
MALMAFSDFEVKNDKSCSKNCLKNYEALKKQYDDLLVKLSDTGFKAATYKRGLTTLEDQIIELEKVKQEKEGFDFKIVKFDKYAKDLNEMLESQITDKSKKRVGYNVVPSPHPLILNRPTTLDLSYSGLEKFKEPEVNVYGPRDSSLKLTTDCDKESDNSKENTNDSLEQHQMTDTKTSSFKSPLKVDKDWKEKFFYPANHVSEVELKKVRKNNDAPIIEDWVSDNEDEVESLIASISQLNDKGFVDSGCSRHMTRNIAHLSDFKDLDGGYVTFSGGAYDGRITGKGTIKTDNLDFHDVYFFKELKFNLFSVSQMCDKKNYVLFTDSECLVLSPNFKLLDENNILLKIPRQDNMYIFDMKNIVPKDSLTCLVAKDTSKESMLWHRRLGHINFMIINKLVKENLVRDLPLKRFENDRTCVACLKGKQHRASCSYGFRPFSVAREGGEERWVPVHATNGKSIKVMRAHIPWSTGDFVRQRRSSTGLGSSAEMYLLTSVSSCTLEAELTHSNEW